jgi:hypothetical protein
MARLVVPALALALGVGASSASPPVVVARVPTGAAPG